MPTPIYPNSFGTQGLSLEEVLGGLNWGPGATNQQLSTQADTEERPLSHAQTGLQTNWDIPNSTKEDIRNVISPQPSAEDKYNTISDEHTALGDQLWEDVKGQYAKGFANIDETTALKLSAARDNQATMQRRGIESVALQDASGFGGLQAGKDLQAQMFGDQLTNKAYQEALESKLGLTQGMIGSYMNRLTHEYNLAGDAEFNAVEAGEREQARLDRLDAQQDANLLSVIGMMAGNPDFADIYGDGEWEMWIDRVLNP